MIKKYIKDAYFVIIPLLIIGITFRYSTFAVSILALLPLLFITHRHTVGIFFLMFGGPLVGAIRSVYPFLPLYGLIFDMLGILLMLDIVRNLFVKHLSGVGGIVITLLFFGIWYFLGPRDDFSVEKYSGMCMHGVAMLIGYFAIEKSSKIEGENLSLLLLISAICFFTFSIQAYSFRVGGLFDYNWFREENGTYDRMNDFAVKIGGYQQIGMLALFAVSIYFAQVKLKLSTALFFALCGTQLILMSGARQSIVGLAIILALRFVVFRTGDSKIRKNFIISFINIIIGLFLAYYVVLLFSPKMGNEMLTQTISEGDFAREMLFLQAIQVFNSYPTVGAGIGGFHAITGSVWPHNFILELLCETGIVGLFISLVLLFTPLIKKKAGLMHITRSNQYFFLILLCIVIRVMVSSDLRESIELFSAVFAITSAGNINKSLLVRDRIFK